MEEEKTTTEKERTREREKNLFDSKFILNNHPSHSYSALGIAWEIIAGVRMR